MRRLQVVLRFYRTLRLARLAVIVLAALAGALTWAAPAPVEAKKGRQAAPQIARIARITLAQGDLVYLPLPTRPGAVSVEGRIEERPVRFFRVAPDRFATLFGVDLADLPGRRQLRVVIEYDGGRREERRYAVQVRDAAFKVQELTLPQEQVEVDAETEARVLREQERVTALLASETPQRLWAGNFLLPVESGETTGTFGLRRLLNGRPRQPHGGEDIRAPHGTPVAASNAGVVRLSDDLFFSGISIILDHGLGVYTMYFHLAEAKVKTGDRVDRGQVIGAVGATGRATGPHLHWGLRVGGVRVNPLAITRLNLE